MKYEIHNGDYVGTVEWQGPGHVAVEMRDPEHQDWFEAYFTAEDSCMSGPVEAAPMSQANRRDSSEAAFEHAAYHLAAYAYKVRRGDGRRHGTHNESRG